MTPLHISYVIMVVYLGVVAIFRGIAAGEWDRLVVVLVVYVCAAILRLVMHLWEFQFERQRLFTAFLQLLLAGGVLLLTYAFLYDFGNFSAETFGLLLVLVVVVAELGHSWRVSRG